MILQAAVSVRAFVSGDLPIGSMYGRYIYLDIPWIWHPYPFTTIFLSAPFLFHAFLPGDFTPSRFLGRFFQVTFQPYSIGYWSSWNKPKPDGAPPTSTSTCDWIEIQAVLGSQNQPEQRDNGGPLVGTPP